MVTDINDFGRAKKEPLPLYGNGTETKNDRNKVGTENLQMGKA